MGCSSAWAGALLVAAAFAMAISAGARALPAAEPIGGSSGGGSGGIPWVVGGVDAPRGRFPYQVFVWFAEDEDDGKIAWFLCGGSLIRDDVILTAGHCVPTEATMFYIDTNVYNNPVEYTDSGPPTRPDDGGYFEYGPYPGNASVLYPGYTIVGGGVSSWDAGLIFLDQCVTNTNVTTVKVATSKEYNAAVRAGSRFLTQGFGTTSNNSNQFGQGGQLSRVMQYAVLDYVSPKACSNLFAYFGDTFITKTMLCAGGVPAAGSKPPPPISPPIQGACQGDSGGAMTFNVLQKRDPLLGSPVDDRVAGITSWGVGCGQPKWPGVYTKVMAASTWINNMLDAKPSPCKPQAQPQCMQSTKTRNWYGEPTATTSVDRASAYAQCCTECLARGSGGCAAFSVNYYTAARAARWGKRREQSPAARAGPACTTCDADCDIYVNIPERLCRPGEKAQEGIYSTCGISSRGSGRIVR